MQSKFSMTLLVLLVPALAFAQSVDDIIARHIQARGGLEKIQAIKSLKMVGKATRGGRAAREVTIVRYWKRPNLVRTETQFGDREIVQAYDGSKAWGIMPFGGGEPAPRELPEQMAASLAQMADFEGPLVNYKEKGNAVRLLGKEDFEGTAVYKLEVTRKDGSTLVSYIDAEYYLELKRVVSRKSPQGEMVEFTTIFSDYKPVSGVMMAHSVTTEAPGAPGGARRGGRGGSFGGGTVNFTSIEANIELDDALFKMPN